MLSKVTSASICGIDAAIVQVEVDISNGLPSFYMTGYLATEVREAGDRVKTAVKNIGCAIPGAKIVVNISPAGVRKSGTMLDLPIAVGILADLQLVPAQALSGSMFIGELSLDGSVNPIKGVLPMLCAAREQGISRCFLPFDNLKETYLIKDMVFYGVRNLKEVIDILNGRGCNQGHINSEHEQPSLDDTEDIFENIKGQYVGKRAVMIAAAGRHNLLMSGPPGSGKTLLASCIPSIMPDMTKEEVLECSKIYSVMGMLPDGKGHILKHPFRKPHHTISASALIGGGVTPMPGEITLAHNGVLFMDELTKFRSEVMEALRLPVEEHEVRIMRNGYMCRFPAQFMLVAAMNPCKCGYYPDMNLCSCSELDIARHIGKLSRPFLDRFDLAVHIDKLSYDEISGKTAAKDEFTSAQMKERVKAAIQRQRLRYAGESINYNSELTAPQIKKYCILNEECDFLMKKAFDKFDLSARGYNKILKVARTIADLEGAEMINTNHLSEAVCFRNIEQKGGVNLG
jgi:magnesium chelatase family protein